MPRRLRRDSTGAWHHVMNRGISKRTVFETRKDVRMFLSFIARQVRAGYLEVHAYAILTTHFHLLVRSPIGQLSAAMQRVQDAYARWFNRSRRRDGPLFRGRFTNRTVESEAYWWNVLAYIDRNPVKAGLCRSPGSYPHGSARWYLRSKGPPWLQRSVVEESLGRRPGMEWDPERYARCLDAPLSDAQRWIAARRASDSTARGPDPLDELLAAAPADVREWMEDKAGRADGNRPGHVVASPRTVRSIVRARARPEPLRTLDLGRKPWPFWEVLEAGALRQFCGLRFREIEAMLRTSRGTVEERLRMHRSALLRSAPYSEECADLLKTALGRDHPSPRSVAGFHGPGAPETGPGRVVSAGSLEEALRIP